MVEGIPVKNRKGKIEIVETLRGLAALLVCLYHFRLSNINYIGHSRWYVDFFSVGWAGVQIFFVISGFIIPFSMSRAGYRVADFGKFMLRRLARIEPPYIISIILVLLLNLASNLAPGFKGAPFQLNWLQIITHLGYLPEHFGFTWLSPVYWSLESEFHFYILIALILPWLFSGRPGFYLGNLSLLILSFFIPLTAFSFMSFFVMGIATCYWKMGKVKYWEFLIVLFVAFWTPYFKGGFFSLDHFSLVASLFGISTALLIAFAEYTNRVFQFLGKISFSLYLIHVPLGGRVLNFLGRYAHTEIMVWLSLLTALTITLIASYFFYRWVEKPALQLSKRITYKKS